jgi:hypothetical protein
MKAAFNGHSTSCQLRARWAGAPPLVGQFLKAARGRTAYEITAVRKVGRAGLGTGAKFSLTVERWNPADVPAHAVVHEWKWDRR